MLVEGHESEINSVLFDLLSIFCNEKIKGVKQFENKTRESLL
jgi:hypothetical protein